MPDNSVSDPIEKPKTRAAGGRFLIVIALGLGIIAGGLYSVKPSDAPYHPDSEDIAATPPASARPVRVAAADLSLIDVPTALTQRAVPLSAARRLQTLSAAGDVNLPQLTQSVLGKLDAGADAVAAIKPLLLGALGQGRSDAYIDTLLNAAVSREDLVVPTALVTVAGRLDTGSLLLSVLLAVDHYQSAERRAFSKVQEHELTMSDSLVGLSLAYYGHPLDHDRIAQANALDGRIAEAQVGQVVEIPAF